ncbi:MAG: hypothetical protein ABI759_08265 [Candidatus Solibacter sp.]
MKFRVFPCIAILTFSVVAEPAATTDSIVDNYVTAAHLQALQSREASMDVEIDASLPKLKKHGKLHALRRISPLGLIRYERAQFEGDGIVNKEIISRYLSAEVEAQRQQAPEIAVTPDNYKFKYKGADRSSGREVHVFEVTPRQKREGLFKGEVWIDAVTFLKVQESGYLVKNPSIFLKKVAFVRKYEIRDGISVPRTVQSVANVRFVGKAELTIDFTNFAIEAGKQAPAADVGGQ